MTSTVVFQGRIGVCRRGGVRPGASDLLGPLFAHLAARFLDVRDAVGLLETTLEYFVFLGNELEVEV